MEFALVTSALFRGVKVPAELKLNEFKTTPFVTMASPLRLKAMELGSIITSLA